MSRKEAMTTKWNEKSIREEIARLDIKTGLKGAKLPISFSNSKRTVGQYTGYGDGAFRFSNHYFQDPDWPVEAARDVIRHEYAHYMDHILYGGSGHGKSWKRCCVEVGALPVRYYDEKRTMYYQQKHRKEAELSSHYNTLHERSVIEHPIYGIGIITKITGQDLNRRVIVEFGSVGEKTLGIAWVDKHCIVSKTR